MGSNLGDRQAALRQGLRELAARGVEIRRVSSVYETDPVGFLDQGSFLNLAVEVSWQGTLDELLEHCLAAEQALGRLRYLKDGPRSLDIDILLAGGRMVRAGRLEIPHARMHLRRFVLVPLEEIAAQAIHPIMRLSVQELLAICPDNSGVRKVGEMSAVEPLDPSGYNPAASRDKEV